LSVLAFLNEKAVGEITLKRNDDGKIYEIQGIEKMYVQDWNKPLAQFITSDYQDLFFRINNNKNLYLERTTKLRLQ
jgi:hypothetical protein